MRSRWQFVLQVGPSLLYILGVFVAGSVPMPALDLGPELSWDKVMHFLVFGGMLLLLLRALAYLAPAWSACVKVLVGAGTASALGGLLELHQAGIPGRQAELMDWVADTLGVALVAALWWGIRRGKGPRGGVAGQRAVGEG